MDKRKKYFCVLDVETAGGLGNPLVYDLGFAIVDKQGKIYEERSFVISEIFDNAELMSGAYYAEKVPNYVADLKNGIRVKIDFMSAREEMLHLMSEYNVQVISAYNLAFDRRALSNTIKFILGQPVKFLTPQFKNIEQLCIWSFACEVIYTQPTFQRVAVDNQWLTPVGNFKTSAEIGWRYISGQVDFEENHTGLEDVKIEVAILSKCFAQHKKHDSGILSNPWRIPNTK